MAAPPTIKMFIHHRKHQGWKLFNKSKSKSKNKQEEKEDSEYDRGLIQ
jgi:hypothetical protein